MKLRKSRPSLWLLLLMLLLVGCAAAEPAVVQPATEPIVEQPAAEPTVEQPATEPAVEQPAADAPTAAPMHESSEEMGMEGLGTANFPISCGAEAQDEFNHGVTLLHSFSFPSARSSFETVAELDPTCAMAYWGVAMTHLDIPWSPTAEEGIVLGQAAVEEALALRGATPREQGYIEAVATLFAEADTVDFPARTLAYEAAMAQLAQDHPEDTEAQVFHALALLMTASPADKSYANQVQAMEVMNPIFAAQPNHPGAAHYLIHSHDYPSLAEGGLEAALRYAEIAPTSPHVQHMPSHIFTRLGNWQGSIDSNRAAAAAAEAALPADHPSGTAVESALHALDYMMYGHLQLAQDDAAQALLDEITAIEQATGGLGSAYALAAMPARYVLERGAWDEGATLALHPSTFAWERFPQAEASIVFARGLSAARVGDVAAANEEVERLRALQAALTDTNQGYWANQVAIQIEEITAWSLLAEGDSEEALVTMQAAATLEDATEKHPVTPGWLLPAHELLGEMLLELDEPAQALAAFETSLQDDPHRFRSLYGAAHAAELAGDSAKAESFYRELVDLAATADGERSEVTQAQEFLAQ